MSQNHQTTDSEVGIHTGEGWFLPVAPRKAPLAGQRRPRLDAAAITSTGVLNAAFNREELT